MLFKSQKFFWASILLNIIFVILGTIFILKRGGVAYIVSKFSFLERPRQENSDRAGDRSRQDLTLYRYQKMRLSIFENSSSSQGGIIFLGDSLTDQGEWQEYFQQINIQNRGISGDTTEGVLNRLDEVIESKPQKIFLLIGTNDFWYGHKNLSKAIANYRQILNLFQKKIPKTEIYIQSVLPIDCQKYNLNIKPQNLVQFNQEIEKLAKEFSYQYINLYDRFTNKEGQLSSQYTLDGVHLNGKGYLVWQLAIAPYVED
jgi:lysophospholipase L1-like esterase